MNTNLIKSIAKNFDVLDAIPNKKISYLADNLSTVPINYI